MEGLPLSVLEAMACGLPSIVTNVGGSAEAVRDQEVGLVIPDNSLDAAEEAILRLVTHPEERARMAEKARETVCQNFDLDDRMSELRAGDPELNLWNLCPEWKQRCPKLPCGMSPAGLSNSATAGNIVFVPHRNKILAASKSICWICSRGCKSQVSSFGSFVSGRTFIRNGSIRLGSEYHRRSSGLNRSPWRTGFGFFGSFGQMSWCFVMAGLAHSPGRLLSVRCSRESPSGLPSSTLFRPRCHPRSKVPRPGPGCDAASENARDGFLAGELQRTSITERSASVMRSAIL